MLSREQLLDLAKGSAELSFDRSIDVHVSRLRAKLGDDSRSPKLLKTVRGAGYLLAGGEVVTPEACSRGKLVYRVYALTAALAVAIMVAMLVLPRFVGSARYLEPQAALVQNMVDRWSARAPEELDRAHGAARSRGCAASSRCSTRTGTSLRSTDRAAARSADRVRARRRSSDEKWALAWRSHRGAQRRRRR